MASVVELGLIFSLATDESSHFCNIMRLKLNQWSRFSHTYTELLIMD